jgi:plasmid stabilization system protein ParE
MRVIFDELAKIELDDGREYYEMEVTGLGKRFKQEVKRAINIIKKMPEIGSPESENIRRYILHKFPYKVLYSIEKDHIYVIAIAHLHREPTYWINRIIT